MLASRGMQNQYTFMAVQFIYLFIGFAERLQPTRPQAQQNTARQERVEPPILSTAPSLQAEAVRPTSKVQFSPMQGMHKVPHGGSGTVNFSIDTKGPAEVGSPI